MTDAAVLTESRYPHEWAGFAAWAFGEDWWRCKWLDTVLPSDDIGDDDAEARCLGQFALSVTGCI